MNQLEDLREWLTAKIDGSEETRGEDGLISDFIRQIDALPSEMGTTPSDPAAGTPRTDLEWACHPSPQEAEPWELCMLELARQLEREIIDVKQRLLPQFQGRTQRAEHERDALLEELIVRRTAIANLHGEINEMREKLRAATTMPCAPSATAAMEMALRPCPDCGYGQHEQVRTILQSATQSATAAPVAWQAKNANTNCEWFDVSKEVFNKKMYGAYEYRALYAGSLPVEETAPPCKHLGKWQACYRQGCHVGRSCMKGERDDKDCLSCVDGQCVSAEHCVTMGLDAPTPQKEQVNHGYDRTASLSAGRYVCLCGGTCSHYDAGEKPE